MIISGTGHRPKYFETFCDIKNYVAHTEGLELVKYE